jgi:UDP-glucuronate 4-epimerase
MKVFVTGAAGFIGFHTVLKLSEQGHDVLAMDNINDYYEVALKYARLGELGISPQYLDAGKVIESSKFGNLRFIKVDLLDRELMDTLIGDFNPSAILHLAAQAGVRYSIEHPDAYVNSNVLGFYHVLEIARSRKIRRVVYASSSSVYGNTSEIPFREDARVDCPVSLYAATKKNNELFAHTYAHLFGIEAIGLRFFTVYGPWGRPDMAPFLFTRAIMEGRPIQVFNNGNLERDFTYISDIVEGITRILLAPERPGGYAVYNIGNNKPEKLGFFIELLEKHTGRTAQKELLPMQPGDVYRTFADISALNHLTGYLPKTSLDDGLRQFVSWYLDYYGFRNGK